MLNYIVPSQMDQLSFLLSEKQKASIAAGLCYLVELAGVEPASEKPTSSVLHAYPVV